MEDKLKAAKAARRAQILGVVSGAMIALYGLVISREHITEIGYWLGLRPLEAETLFVFVDFIAIYGKVLTNKRFTAKTRRIGYKFLIFGGTVSLACNVGSGILHRLVGAALYGAFIVAIVAMLEYAIANTKAKAINFTPRQPRAAKPKAKTSTGRAWSPARRAAHEQRKASPVSPAAGPGSISTEELEAITR